MSFATASTAQGPGSMTGGASTMGGAGSYQASDMGSSEYETLKRTITQQIRTLSIIKSRLERITAALGTPQDTPSVREELTKLIGQGRGLDGSVKTNLRALAAQPGITLEEKGRHRVAYNTLQKQFEMYTNDFQNAAKIATAKASTTANHQSATAEEREQERLANEQRLKQIEVLDERIDEQEAIIQEREQDIMELHKDLVEMHTIAQNVNVMIDVQGEKLRRVEETVHEAADMIDDGVDDIKVADTYQKKAMKKYWWVFLVVGAGIAVILLLILL